MRSLIAILALFGLLHAQDYWVRWNGELTTPDQREFAGRYYEIGETYQKGAGSKLAALGKVETSLGTKTNHDEDSFGDFGLSAVSLQALGYGSEVADSLRNETLSLERQGVFALRYLDHRKQRLISRGYSEGAADFLAAYWYCGGSIEYAIEFYQWMRFFKEHYND